MDDAEVEIHSQSEQISRFYALYSVHVNKSVVKTDVGEKGNESESGGSESSNKDGSNDYSLSVVASSLTAEAETEVRKYVSKRMAKGSMHQGIGSVTNIDIGPEEKTVSATCYYCLLQKEKPSADDADLQEWIVCFVSTTQDALELFLPDLDQYSNGLWDHLDEKHSSTQLTALTSHVRPYLEQWFDVSVQYMARPILWLGQDLQYLISAALSNTAIEYMCNEEQKKDLTRFVEACSIAQQSKGESGDTLSDIVLVNIAEAQPDNTTLNVIAQDDNFKLKNKKACTSFCHEWAKSLREGNSSDPSFVKQLTDTYKLKAVQDINSFQRLIHKAESDHYALYRALVFLQKSSNGAILLNHAEKEKTSKDAKAVLHSLEDYIQEAGGFRLVD